MELMKTKTEKEERERVKLNIISLLQERLVDSIDLMMQAKQAHWNTKGKHFYPLHLLFDEVAEATEKNIDLIAERMAQLGGTADGTIQTVGKKTKLPMYPLHIVTGEEHSTNLANALLQYCDLEKTAIIAANEAQDFATADMLIDISREVNKYYWLVSAHVYTTTQKQVY